MRSQHEIINNGTPYTLYSADEDGLPYGSAVGKTESKKEADSRFSEMLADQGVHLGVIKHKRAGFKLINDGRQWVAWYSNAVMDLQAEYFPMKATDAYIARVDRKQIEKPGLWWFHVLGTKHGSAEWLGRIGLLTLGIGTFDDSTIANSFKAYYRDHNMELSHGFWYDPAKFKGGAYNYYNTFEISTLPPGQAANPYTVFEVFDHMQPEKLKALAAIIGDHEAELIATQTATASKALLDAGVQFKAMASGKPMATDDEEAEGETPTKPKGKSVDSAIETRIAAVENNLTTQFKAITDQLAAVLTPLAAVLQNNEKSQKALQDRIDQLDSNFKGFARLVYNEFAMQPPATQSPATQLQPNDPAMQFMQAMNQTFAQQPAAPGAQQVGQKSNPLGPIGEVFGAIGLGGKNMHQSPFGQPTFEIPGAFGTPSTAAFLQNQQPIVQGTPQPPPQQPTQPPPAQGGAPGSFAPPSGMNMQQFMESLMPNQQPGVGIPRLG